MVIPLWFYFLTFVTLPKTIKTITNDNDESLYVKLELDSIKQQIDFFDKQTMDVSQAEYLHDNAMTEYTTTNALFEAGMYKLDSNIQSLNSKIDELRKLLNSKK